MQVDGWSESVTKAPRTDEQGPGPILVPPPRKRGGTTLGDNYSNSTAFGGFGGGLSLPPPSPIAVPSAKPKKAPGQKVSWAPPTPTPGGLMIPPPSPVAVRPRQATSPSSAAPPPRSPSPQRRQPARSSGSSGLNTMLPPPSPVAVPSVSVLPTSGTLVGGGTAVADGAGNTAFAGGVEGAGGGQGETAEVATVKDSMLEDDLDDILGMM